MRRGQATVELALGSIIFVGVLLIGIHMAEYAQLALKVQEAEASALWDATHHRIQTRANDGATFDGPFHALLDESSGVAAKTRQRYRDFDGISTVNGGNVVGRALTRGSNLEVTCEEEPSLHFAASPSARAVLHDVGGLRCTASAKITAVRVPRSFLQKEEGGFFRQRMFRNDPIPVCGMGLPENGECHGSLSLMLNDWGLTGDETRTCKSDCQSPYSGMVRRLFNGGGGAGVALADEFAGDAPASAAEFHFSYAGVEEDYLQGIPTEQGMVGYNTGGSNLGMVPFKERPNCFLGKNCP